MSKPHPSSEVVGTVQLSEKTEIRVRIAERKGNPAVDVRLFWVTGGEMQPSNNGFAIAADRLEHLVAALQHAADRTTMRDGEKAPAHAPSSA